MANRQDHVRARRRERVLERRLGEALKLIDARDATIKSRSGQIGELITQKADLIDELRHLARLLGDFAGDMKVVADVLQANGADHAEARLRTIAEGCENHRRRLGAIAGAPDGCAMVGEERRNA